MAAWKDEDVAKTRERLWHSLEMTYVKGILIALLVAETLFPLIFLLRGEFRENFWPLTLIVGAVVAVPFVGFCLWQVVRMFRHAESYTFCKAMLVNAQYSQWRSCYYFTVRLEDMDGRVFPADTRPIFHTHGIAPPVVTDYMGSTVTIGYNEETGNVVVIG